MITVAIAQKIQTAKNIMRSDADIVSVKSNQQSAATLEQRQSLLLTKKIVEGSIQMLKQPLVDLETQIAAIISLEDCTKMATKLHLIKQSLLNQI